MKNILSSRTSIFLSLLGVFVLVIYAYFPGLLGGFLLDDKQNLQHILVYSRFEGMEAFIRYILSNDSGTLYRPISTLSFLLNSTDFTVNLFNFKVTNLVIHLVNGLVLYFVIVQLLQLSPNNSSKNKLIALMSMAFWLLHPYLVSTTLYVVQRMALLSTFFVLTGMLLYLRGRVLLALRYWRGVLYILLSVYLFTLLSILSKENGVVLPILILLLEYYIIQRNPKNSSLGRLMWMIWIPSVLILLAFILRMPNFIEGYSQRDFTVIERLLTESRALTSYLYHLFSPSYMTEGVFTDGFNKSTSLFTPFSTFTSIVFILISIAWSIVFRKKYPVVSFSVLFFFIAHVIESSFIPLELYFEHRNYLPSLFLFLPLSVFLEKTRFLGKLKYLIVFSLLIYLSFQTRLRAELWADNDKLFAETFKHFPSSIRLIEQEVLYFYNNRNIDEALRLLNESIKEYDNISLRVNLVSIKCNIGQVKRTDLTQIENSILLSNVTRDDIASLSQLLKNLFHQQCLKSVDDNRFGRRIVSLLKDNKGYQVDKVRKQIISYDIKFKLLFGEIEASYNQTVIYLDKYNDFFDVQEILKEFIDRKEYFYAKKITKIMIKKLNQRKFRYTDRDYLKQALLMDKELMVLTN